MDLVIRTVGVALVALSFLYALRRVAETTVQHAVTGEGARFGLVVHQVSIGLAAVLLSSFVGVLPTVLGFGIIVLGAVIHGASALTFHVASNLREMRS